MKKLKIEQILRMHEILIEKTGGASGIRDFGSLDSAINIPFQSFDGEDIYKTVRAKSARLAYSIVNNHPFIDGNKRTGILAMVVFLEMNGIEIICTDDELAKIGLELAAGKISYEELLNWIIANS